MKNLKKVAEEQGWDTRAFDKAFTLNDTVQKVKNQKEYFKLARKMVKGQIDPSNNFIVRADCYNLQINGLDKI